MEVKRTVVVRKKKKKTPHLDFYNTCMKNKERMINTFFSRNGYYGGLCNAANWKKINGKMLKRYFKPTYEESCQLSREGKSSVFWGSGSGCEKIGIFTPLRQTIVLLMAAINEEL